MVVVSRTKLLVIMHADKMDAKKRNFQWNLDLYSKPSCIEIHRRSLVTYREMTYLKSEIKIDIKNHRKTILILL